MEGFLWPAIWIAVGYFVVPRLISVVFGLLARVGVG